MTELPLASSKPVIQRQIVLPLSTAIEIAYQNIRLRLARSLLVTSGIVLAIAFLMSILATGVIVDGMRDWIASPAHAATSEARLARARLETIMRSTGVPTTPDEVADNRIQTRWIISLALLVAFVGILNAMLMSVTERFREIGTMKCLGALDSFIIKLFLLESLFQGVLGTILGIAIGLILSFISAGVTYGRVAFENLLLGKLLMSIAICAAVGMTLTVAGALYPAWKAAKMQPIEAMRVET